MIQITIIKITGYGPWTLTLGSDREHENTDASGITLSSNTEIIFSQKWSSLFQTDLMNFLQLQTALHLRII